MQSKAKQSFSFEAKDHLYFETKNAKKYYAKTPLL
jgi:hypothetical protein